MFRLELSAITLSPEGLAVRIRPCAPGDNTGVVVEGWDGSAWVSGPDVVDWANGRPATPEELAALGIPNSDWPSLPPPTA
jgi:hypothetical protein